MQTQIYILVKEAGRCDAKIMGAYTTLDLVARAKATAEEAEPTYKGCFFIEKHYLTSES